MTFGQAIEALKHGKKVARAGWNGKGMFLWLKPATEIKTEWCIDPMLIDLCAQNGGAIQALGTICMFTHDSTDRKAILTGWLASQSDMLLEDWYVVGEEEVEQQTDMPHVVVHQGIAACQIDRYNVRLVDGDTVVREIGTGDYRSVGELRGYIDDYLADPRYNKDKIACAEPVEEEICEKPANAPTVPLKFAMEVVERIEAPEIDEIMKAGCIYEITTAPTLMSVKKKTLLRVIRWMWYKIWEWEK